MYSNYKFTDRFLDSRIGGFFTDLHVAGKDHYGGSCVRFFPETHWVSWLCMDIHLPQAYDSIPFYPWKPRKLVGIWTKERKNWKGKNIQNHFFCQPTVPSCWLENLWWSISCLGMNIPPHATCRDVESLTVVGWTMTRWKMFQPPMPWIYDLRGMDDLTKF